MRVHVSGRTAAVFLVLAGSFGCSDSGSSTGTIAGTVTDAQTKKGLSGVTVTVQDTSGKSLATANTGSSGGYSVNAPLGTVQVAFSSKSYSSPAPMNVGVISGNTVTVNVALSEAKTGAPMVSLSVSGDDFGYGKTAKVTASATDPDGDKLTYQWTNNGLGKVTPSADGTSATLTFPTLDEAMAPNTPDPENPGQFLVSGYDYQSERFGILPIMADTRGAMSVTVTVNDGRGQTASATISPNAASILTSEPNVAIGTRVYLNSGHDGASAWKLTPATGSTATLDDPTSRTPSFVADKTGSYTLTEGTNKIIVYAGDWVGAIGGAGPSGGETVVASSNCTMCHNGTIAPNVFTPWAETLHAQIFADGIDGKNGDHYGPSCLVCHTVGYDLGVKNNGFDDVAAENHWTFPSVLKPGNWVAMTKDFPKVAQLANVQCENCHGPNGNGQPGDIGGDPAHGQMLGSVSAFDSPRVSFAAEMCGTCHASGTHHHNYSEWRTSQPGTGYSHSKVSTAATTGANAKGLSASCGRCHTAQGYTIYLDQLAAGNIGGLPPTPNVTSADAQPITCQTCHNPHSAKNPHQIRVDNDTGLLPSGFEVTGAGEGALCMTCHNSRNGAQTGSTTATYLHEDSETYNGGNPTGYSAPHQACQTDVFVGQNAYFLGSQTPLTSKHSAVEDTCVGCHMKNNPATHAGTTSEHNFFISDSQMGSLCPKCHGSGGVDGRALQAAVEGQMEALATKLGSAVLSKVNGAGTITVVAYDDGDTSGNRTPTELSSAKFQINTNSNPVTAAKIEEVHGQIAFELTFTNPVSVQLTGTGAPTSPVSLTMFGVQLGSLGDSGGQPLFSLNGNMVRAGWNYFLIEGDQSKGVHNPDFTTAVLNASIGQNVSN